MKALTATKFKETCLALLDNVGPDGIIITKHGKPVAKLIPIERSQEHLIGSMKGRFEVKGGSTEHGDPMGCSILTPTY